MKYHVDLDGTICIVDATCKNTVERYLDLLEQTFVIFRLRSFSTNPRKEIAKGATDILSKLKAGAVKAKV